MSGRRLDGPDFGPCPDRRVVFGPGQIGQEATHKEKTQESRDRLLFEKVTELAFSQNETCRVTRERDALTRALVQIAEGDEPKARRFARDILAKLASGELRKAV